MENKKLDSYSQEVVEAVKEALSCYDSCHVVTEFGKCSVSTSICIKKEYAEDYHIETFNSEDVFSSNELILNYINNFKSFPPFYHGERDYQMLNKAREERLEVVFDKEEQLVLGGAY